MDEKDIIHIYFCENHISTEEGLLILDDKQSDIEFLKLEPIKEKIKKDNYIYSIYCVIINKKNINFQNQKTIIIKNLYKKKNTLAI
jgi:hypothetical protein